MLRTFSMFALALAAAGCASLAPAPATMTVEGELTYAARIALPGSAQAIVEVRDTSQPEGSGVVAEQRIDLRGRQIPVPFALTVDLAKLDAGKRYAARGAVNIAGRPAWATDPVPLTARSGVVELGTLIMQPVRLQAFPSAFRCGDLRATIDFLDSRARLTVGQTTWELRQTRTANGARFEAVDDPSTWFWNRGDGGRLSVNGREYPECRLVRSSGADLRGVEWVVEDIAGGGIIDRSRATLVFGADGRADGALVLHADDRRSIVARRGGKA